MLRQDDIKAEVHDYELIKDEINFYARSIKNTEENRNNSCVIGKCHIIKL
jgi:hypothetical protein